MDKSSALPVTSSARCQLLAIAGEYWGQNCAVCHPKNRFTDLGGEGAHQEVRLGKEVDVQDDPSQRVLSVAVVKARRPRDGVVTDELVVRIPKEGERGTSESVTERANNFARKKRNKYSILETDLVLASCSKEGSSVAR